MTYRLPMVASAWLLLISQPSPEHGPTRNATKLLPLLVNTASGHVMESEKIGDGHPEDWRSSEMPSRHHAIHHSGPWWPGFGVMGRGCVCSRRCRTARPYPLVDALVFVSPFHPLRPVFDSQRQRFLRLPANDHHVDFGPVHLNR